jgi:hypothetical protein
VVAIAVSLSIILSVLNIKSSLEPSLRAILAYTSGVSVISSHYSIVIIIPSSGVLTILVDNSVASLPLVSALVLRHYYQHTV